jgi:hypothetical protein
MLLSFSKVDFGISFASVVGIYCLTIAPSASATSTSRPLPDISFNSSNVGKSFQFDFNGNISTQNVAGLSSTAVFTLKSFSGTQATFDVALSNTSSGSIKSRTSALGFNVYTGLGTTNQLNLVSTKTSVSGLFSNTILGGSFPNQFGNVDVCFISGNNCQGGTNGGVSTGEAKGNFSFTLAFSNNVSSFALGNFGVRYQSITGSSLGTSGTGHGSRRKVSEPGTTTALSLFFVAALGSVKKHKNSVLESSTKLLIEQES